MGEGDPYITTLTGQVYQFDGIPGKRYNFFTQGPLKILPRIAAVPNHEGKTCFGGVDVVLEDKWTIYIAPDGHIYVTSENHQVKIQVKQCSLDAPGHNGKTQDDPHPLMGVPHMNIYITHLGDVTTPITGLMFDNSPDAETKYAVEG